MIAKFHAYVVKELKLADSEKEKSTDNVVRMKQRTLEAFAPETCEEMKARR